jgi:mycofactocin glycosyltransferase
MARVTDYRLDPSYRRHGRVVIAGSPLKLFRLSAAGVKVAVAIEQGLRLPDGHAALTDRLVDAGAIHPQPLESPFSTADVTVVVPAFNATPPSVPDVKRVVVDDGSTPPLAVRQLRLEANRGPAAARNAGLAAVGTPLVAFVDTDVELPDGWLAPLLPHFSDRRVALVAPRVASAPASSAIGRYETTRSPLDLGDVPGRISPGTRISYVPAAVILARTDAIRSIGGFDESMRWGEDVDLVWRLVDTGHRCRYEPASMVWHRPRSTLGAWAHQRYAYGRSASRLDGKHPGAVTPLRISGWSALVWALVLLRHPFIGAAVAAGTIAALRRKLPDVPAMEAARLAGLGHVYAGRQVAGAITRAWWPAAAVLGVVWKRLRSPLFAAVVVPPLLEWRTGRGSIDIARYAGLRLADDVVYGSGLWRGVIELRRAGALRPTFTNWPRRATG